MICSVIRMQALLTNVSLCYPSLQFSCPNGLVIVEEQQGCHWDATFRLFLSTMWLSMFGAGENAMLWFLDSCNSFDQ